MATRKEVLEVGGREVTVSNPDKVYFPVPGYTKLDVVTYFLSIADGALAGVRGRPMALKRFVDGIDKEPFFQKRAPDNRPEWMRVATLTFPSGRTADEIVLDEAAGLAWVANLGCIDLNPHPVRADDLDHPDELRVDLDPVPGVPWSQVREVAGVVHESLDAVGLVGWPKTSGSRGIHVNVRIEPRWTYGRSGARRWRWPATSSGAPPRSPPRNGGRRSATGCSSTTTRTPRTGRSPPRIPSGRCPTRGSRSRCAGTRSPTSWPRTSRWPPSRPCTRARRRRRGDRRGRRIAGFAARALGEGRGRGPGRRAVAAELRQAGGRAAARPAVEEAQARRGVRGPRQGRRAAARGRGRARRSRGGRRPQRRPADRVGGHPPHANRPPKVEHPGHRDRSAPPRRPR